MSKHPAKPEPVPSHLPLSSVDDIGAIAVDTNIYHQWGFRVRAQPLISLADVKSLRVKWLVPEIWERELQSHVIEHIDKQLTLRTSLAKTHEWGDKQASDLAEKLSENLHEETAEGIATKLLTEHFRVARPVRLLTSWRSGPQVLDDYFAARAPFEASGPKTKEFPDALALVTLREWAAKNRTRVLVVSQDKGCLRACESSEHLVGMSSLPDALNRLRTLDEGRTAVIYEYERLLSDQLLAEDNELLEKIEEVVRGKLEELDLNIDYQEERDRDVEPEVTSIELDDLKPISYADGRLELRVFHATPGELSFVCVVSADVHVKARFPRSYRGRSRSLLWNAPEESARGDVEFDAVVTLEPTGALSATTLPHASIKSIEVHERHAEVDFGTVQAWEPDFQE
jgi:hypothetical protein